MALLDVISRDRRRGRQHHARINGQVDAVDEAGRRAGKEDDGVSHFIRSGCSLQGGDGGNSLLNERVALDALLYHCSVWS